MNNLFTIFLYYFFHRLFCETKMWFEKQRLENIRSLLNHYFPKFNNSECTWFGKIQNMNPFMNGYGTVVDPGTVQGSTTV